jgi:hypothetical protein
MVLTNVVQVSHMAYEAIEAMEERIINYLARKIDETVLH